MEGIEWPVLVALFVAWVANFACLSKGIKSIGKVSVCVAHRYIPTCFNQAGHNIIGSVLDRLCAVRSALHTFDASGAAGRRARRHPVLSEARLRTTSHL